MKHINTARYHLKNTAVALGKFEGIHIGHQLLIDKIVEKSAEGMTSVVFTFDRPPSAALHHVTDYPQIYTRQERQQILKDKGVDVLIEHPFTRKFASLTPEKFIREVLVERTGAKVIAVGTDFRFGKKRSGSITDLKKLENELGYELIVFDKLKVDEEDVSSTRIRQCLENAQMEKTAQLLGRPFAVTEVVSHGKMLGRTIHFPTVNQNVDHNKLLPKDGVYVSRVLIGNQIFYGVTNIGVRPTVHDGGGRNVETHILDYSGDLYDQEITVELLHFHRQEMKFSSVEELQSQLALDVAFGRQYMQEM